MQDERYATAFSRYDVKELNMLLHVDATLRLPPYSTWMRGAPWALQVLEFRNDRISGITAYRDTGHLFSLFGLPDRLGEV
ncbi:hypothetical protein [Streptomyces virginiae]|uniref:hypothetical protein n=1 Tax=Streptomyces virginiae TaxID=1961 RepID=UPI00386B7703|nr:hypothetical protein OG253_40095 [Streptomyces virginiae]